MRESAPQSIMMRHDVVLMMALIRFGCVDFTFYVILKELFRFLASCAPVSRVRWVVCARRGRAIPFAANISHCADEILRSKYEFVVNNPLGLVIQAS